MIQLPVFNLRFLKDKLPVHVNFCSTIMTCALFWSSRTMKMQKKILCLSLLHNIEVRFLGKVAE